MCKIVLIAAVCGFLLNFVNFSSGQASNQVEWNYYNSFVTVSGKCLDTANINTKVFVFQIYISKVQILELPVHVQNFVEVMVNNLQDCKLNVIKEELFRKRLRLKIFQFSFNNLWEIPVNVFSKTSLLQILQLDQSSTTNNLSFLSVVCARNLLQHWDITWFTNTKNLQIIDFSLNKITALPAKAFYGLKKLKEIRLNYNEINTIHADAFKGLNNLKYLGLAYNKLRVLEARAFPNALVVHELSLHKNYLNFLSTSLMENVKVVKLGMRANPWNCFCLDRIFDWLYRNNGSTVDLCDSVDFPVCAYPDTNSKQCTETVDESLSDTYFKELHDSFDFLLYWEYPTIF